MENQLIGKITPLSQMVGEHAKCLKRIAELEAALMSVRKEILKDHSMGFPSERDAQSLMLADIDLALAVK